MLLLPKACTIPFAPTCFCYASCRSLIDHLDSIACFMISNWYTGDTGCSATRYTGIVAILYPDRVYYFTAWTLLHELLYLSSSTTNSDAATDTILPRAKRGYFINRWRDREGFSTVPVGLCFKPCKVTVLSLLSFNLYEDITYVLLHLYYKTLVVEVLCGNWGS